ncbi:MAG: hypothetical protein Q7S28_02560, partial [bacterium]|nr:hypothetical protein [bacterium]
KTLHAPRFSVCVVDTVGAQDCELYTIFIEAAPKVAPQPAPQPAPLPKVEVKITVTNKSCSVKQDYSDFTTYTKDMTGTASGPVGTKLILTHTPLPISCGSWTLVDVNSRGNACEREESDPETTNWSFQNPNTATTWTGDTLVVEFAGKYASTGETKCP